MCVCRVYICVCVVDPWITYNYIYTIYIYAIMKTMCPPGYHPNNFVATHTLGYMMNRTSCAQVHELPQSHRGDNRESTLFS